MFTFTNECSLINSNRSHLVQYVLFLYKDNQNDKMIRQFFKLGNYSVITMTLSGLVVSDFQYHLYNLVLDWDVVKFLFC